MSVKIADKIVQYNNGSYFLMDSSAVEYIDKNGDSHSVKDVLENSIDKLTKEGVEGLLGLTKEEIEAMADLILDTEVRIDKTYSSSKIYQDIQQCLNDSKTFTLLELGKFSGVSYKIVTSTSEMTSESIIYLIANGNTYDMYIVEENGATTKIGDMDVDLSQYYTKTEIDNDFLKKVDAVGKYATITTLTTHTNDADIHVTTADKTKWNKVDEKVDKTSITTTIDSTSTDEQVASAKAVYDGLENINDFSVQVVKDNLNLNNITETGIYFFSRIYTPVNTPAGVNGWLLVMKGSYSDTVKQVWYSLNTADSNSYDTFERYYGGDTWSEWTKFLTETDVNLDNYFTKSDIVDNLTSTDTDKPLSANQGKILNEKLNKTDANKLNCVTIDNVSIKEYILTNFTETGKTYHLIAKATCTDLPKASNFYITVETPGLYTYKVTAKELNDSNGKYVCTYRTISSSWTAWEKVLSSSDTTGLTNVRKVFCDINELNNAKGTNMSLVIGEDNTEKIINVLGPYEEFTNWFGNTTSTDRFGIDKSMGSRLNVVSIQRFTNSEGFAYAITNEGKVFSRFFQNGVLFEWNYDSTDLTEINTRLTQLENTTTGKPVITIDNTGGKEVKYFKIANTPAGDGGYMVSMVGLRINTTASNEIFSLNKYNNKYKYTYNRILTPIYTTSTNTVAKSESCYLVFGNDYALYAVIGSYCLATIEFIGTSGTLIKEKVDSLPTVVFSSYKQTSAT